MATDDVLVPDTEETKPTGLPSDEYIAMNEEELIAGLLAAADFETDEAVQKPIEIRRNGKLYFRFRIHPLSEKDLQKIRKQSTNMYKNKGGGFPPKIEGDLRVDEYRSRKIYAATVDEDREKLWDNPKVKSGLNAKGKDILESWEVISAVLMGGEKFEVTEIIDDISGYNDDDKLEPVEVAKN